MAMLAACSSSGSTVSSSSSASRTSEATLTVVLPAIDPSLAQVYVASEEGYFAAENLNVKIVQAGSNVLSEIVSGQADLAEFGTSNALLPIPNGEQTSIIYANTDGSASSFMVGTKTVTSIPQCKRTGTLSVGSGTYANAAEIKIAAHATYDIVPMEDFPTIAASLVSGGLDCAVGTLGNFAPQIDSGQVHLLVDPRKPATYPAGADPSLIPTGAVFGMKAKLQSERNAIVRFLTAYQKALTYLNTHSAAQIASVLRMSKDFAPESQATLTQEVQANLQLKIYAPYDGELPSAVWPQTLTYFKNGGVNSIDPGSSAYSYSSCVDMSYYDAATGKTAA